MSKRKPAAETPLPPPPATGGTHTWDGTQWVTTQATEDAAAPTLAPVATETVAETPVSEA